MTAISMSELGRWLRRRLDERAPAAVVRFGDGEGKLLVADPDDEGSMRVAMGKLERETGRPFTAEETLEVKALVALAFEEADVLGIGSRERFSDDHKLWMDRLAVLHAERVAGGRRRVPLADCLLSHELLPTLPDLLEGRRVSAISCRDVKPPLEADWGLDDVAAYQVPSQHFVRDVDGEYEAAMHGVSIWPEVHRRLRSELTVREPGEVFLVGAGLFGKDLCIRVRELGGIALDMGSALDRITGKITRGPRRRVLDLYAGGMPVAEIAASLKRLYGAEVDSRTIRQGLENVLEVDAWRGRPLGTTYRAVRLDAMQVELAANGRTRAHVCSFAVGVRADGREEALGFWWRPCDEEDDSHRAICEDLGRRGLRDVSIAPVEDGERSPAAVARIRRRIDRAIETRGGALEEWEANSILYLAMIRP